MVREIELAPSKIRFMHDRISSKFSNGISLDVVITKIERGEMDVYDLPKIRVVRKDGYYYAFDNRRLYVYRVLHYRGKLDKVGVKLASLRRFHPERFSTKNNGESVRLNRGITLPHSYSLSPPSSPETFSDVEDDLANLFTGLRLGGVYDLWGITDDEDDDSDDDVNLWDLHDYDDDEDDFDYLFF